MIKSRHFVGVGFVLTGDGVVCIRPVIARDNSVCVEKGSVVASLCCVHNTNIKWKESKWAELISSPAHFKLNQIKSFINTFCIPWLSFIGWSCFNERSGILQCIISPYLHCDESVVHHDFFRQEISTYCGFVLVAELLIHILVHQRGLPNSSGK